MVKEASYFWGDTTGQWPLRCREDGGKWSDTEAPSFSLSNDLDIGNANNRASVGIYCLAFMDICSIILSADPNSLNIAKI